MYKILKKRTLNPTVTLMEIDAPAVAKKAQPGQFIILRVDDAGERIPLTIADYDADAGSVTIIFQIVGATTEKLNHLRATVFTILSVRSAEPPRLKVRKRSPWLAAVSAAPSRCPLQKSFTHRVPRYMPSSVSATRIL